MPTRKSAKNKYTKFDYSANHYSRIWTLELYQEGNYLDVLSTLKTYQYYLYIKHDKDIWTEGDILSHKEYCENNGICAGDPKKVHYHACFKFNNPRYRDTIAKELGVDRKFVLPVITTFNDALLYLTHEKYDDKWHYSVDECHGTLLLKLKKLIGNDILDENKSLEIINIILSYKNVNKLAVLIEVNKRGLYSHYRQGYSIYRDLIEDHNLGFY